MKNILNSIYLFILSTILVSAQGLPTFNPSCTKGTLKILVFGDSTTTREDSIQRLATVLDIRATETIMPGFFINPTRQVLVENIHLEMDSLHNSLILALYNDSDFLEDFGDDQKLAKNLSNYLFKTNSIKGQFEADPFDFKKMRDVANIKLRELLRQDTTFENDLLAQMNVINSKVIESLTVVSGTQDLGDQNKVIVVSYGKSSLLVKRALDALPENTLFRNEWRKRISHLSIGSGQASLVFPNHRFVLRKEGQLLHSEELTDDFYFVIKGNSNQGTGESKIGNYEAFVNASKMLIPFLYDEEVDLLKRHYLQELQITGEAVGPLLQFENGFDPQGDLIGIRTKPVFSFYDYFLTNLSRNMESNCSPLGVNLGASRIDDGENLGPYFEVGQNDVPRIKETFTTSPHIDQLTGKLTHNKRNVNLKLPPIESLTASPGVYQQGDRIFGEKYIEMDEKPSVYDFGELLNIRSDEIYSVEWTISGSPQFETDKNIDSLPLPMEDFKDKDFTASISVTSIYGKTHTSSPFIFTAVGCKAEECCFDGEGYISYFGFEDNQVQRCEQCTEDFSSPDFNGDGKLCAKEPVPFTSLNSGTYQPPYYNDRGWLIDSDGKVIVSETSEGDMVSSFYFTYPFVGGVFLVQYNRTSPEKTCTKSRSGINCYSGNDVIYVKDGFIYLNGYPIPTP